MVYLFFTMAAIHLRDFPGKGTFPPASCEEEARRIDAD